MGLREKKKARTRELISDLAVQLFIKKGFANVTVAQIAEGSNVAVATLFNYFPTKESIIFDREDELDAEIVAAIRERAKGESVLDALNQYFMSSKLFNPPKKKNFADFMKLVKSSPELTAYFRSLWDEKGKIVASEIRRDSNTKKGEAECIARFIVEAVSFACYSPSPKDVLNLSFNILRTGWKP